jgi:hypothetical protein
MGKRVETIRHALQHKGITITDGIPEHIIEELHKNGYIIRKTKEWKKQNRKSNTGQQTLTTGTNADATNATRRPN